MIRGKYRRERLALLYSLCFIGAMVCSMMCLGIYGGLTTTNVDTTTDGEDQDTHPIIPNPMSSGDGTVYYVYNSVIGNVNDAEFTSNLGDWVASPGDGTVGVSSGRCVFTVDQGIYSYNNYPRIVLELPTFWQGEIALEWGTLANCEAGERLELKYSTAVTPDWSSATLIDSTSSLTEDLETYPISHLQGTNNPNFKLAIIFCASKGLGTAETARIDFVIITAYEFCIWESNGDQIPQQNSQTIQTYINSSNGVINNVRIQYKLNNNDFSSGATIASCGFSGGNYTYTFSEGIYDFNDDVYYRFIYNNGVTDRYSTASGHPHFDTYDNTNPSLTFLNSNDSTPMYYEDIAVTFRASEINGDSNITSIYLYAKNGSAATTSDYRISSNMSAFPYQNGDFKFILKHFILTARQSLYVLVRVTDVSGRYTDYTPPTPLTPGDDVVPTYSFISINDSTVQYWEDVKITYNVAEPSDASGFASSGANNRLAYKLNSAPSAFNDYNGLISPSNTITQNGGNIEFIMPDSIYGYNDKVYYWILPVDSAFPVPNVNQNDYANNRNFDVTDLVGPVAVSQASNTQDANYYADKTLTFQITEPTDASGVLKSSFRVWYRVGNSDLNVSVTQLTYSSESPTDFYNFMVPKASFALGNTVYFKVNGTDNYGNKFTTVVEHFHVSDLEGPTISFVPSGSNNDTADYTRATTMVYDSDDVAGGVGFETIVMFVKNGSAASYYGSGCVRVNYDSNDGTEYTFIIPAILHSARQNLYWIVRANDTLGNYRELSGNFQVDDLVQPFIQFSSMTPSISTIDYNEDVTVWWYIYEPIAGAGFNGAGTNLAVYYYVGTVTDTPDTWNDGTLAYSGGITINGGTFGTVIPSTAFKYGDVVYFWGWVKDQASPANNENNTFINRRQFTVIDTIVPVLTIQSSSLNNASYDDSKIITYNAIEPNDASGLKSATVYWRRNNNQVTEFLNDGSQANATILPHSGSGLTLTISYAVLHAIGAKYGDTIYFIVVVVDKALYKSTSGPDSFKIGDDVLPTLIQHPDNTDNIIKTSGKTFSAQVWDPDYDYSSGVSSIHIFYLLNDESVSTSHYTASIVPQESIVKAGGTYTFKILGTVSGTWADDTVVYYIIRVIDINGNINISTVQSFIVRKMVTVTYLLPSTTRTYYNTPYINLSLSVDIPCDLWYQIDNQPESSPIYGLTLTAYFNFATEGAHNITAFYFSSKYNKTFSFTTDFTPPSAVGEVRIEMSGSSVRLSWAPATDATSYNILRSKSEEGPYIQIGSTSARTFSDYATDFGTTYYYKVVAVDRANNQTQPVAVISINVPIPIWIWIALLGVVGAVALVFIKVRASAKSKAAIRDLGTLSEEEKQKFTVSDEEIAAKQKKAIETEKIADETQWKKIDWKAQTTAPKGKYDLYVDESEKLFWKHNIEVLVEEGVKYELAGKFGLALKAYQIALRAAENDIYGDKEILAYLKDKLVSIYSNPLIQ